MAPPIAAITPGTSAKKKAAPYRAGSRGGINSFDTANRYSLGSSEEIIERKTAWVFNLTAPVLSGEDRARPRATS
jgi:hypothetical protein